MPSTEGKQGETNAPLCAKGCGFFGNPAARSLCSKCYAQWLLDVAKSSSDIADVDGPAKTTVSAPPLPREAFVDNDAEPSQWSSVQQLGKVPRSSGRCNCNGCKKKVGLMGFECRCGSVFCGMHRHPEQHGCTFDFKTAGREAVAAANPLIKADKLQRI